MPRLTTPQQPIAASVESPKGEVMTHGITIETQTDQIKLETETVKQSQIEKSSKASKAEQAKLIN